MAEHKRTLGVLETGVQYCSMGDLSTTEECVHAQGAGKCLCIMYGGGTNSCISHQPPGEKTPGGAWAAGIWSRAMAASMNVWTESQTLYAHTVLRRYSLVFHFIVKKTHLL